MLALPIRSRAGAVYGRRARSFDAHLGLHRGTAPCDGQPWHLRANTEAIVRSQGLGSDEKAMLIMPVSYCFGASVMHSHLYQGGGVVYDSRFMFPDKVLRAINTYGVRRSQVCHPYTTSFSGARTSGPSSCPNCGAFFKRGARLPLKVSGRYTE